ncbi:MAG: YfhO family protein [Oscillospiraceae bacterium]|nr:YfhO family protein [Oscillospiraceae bacterium]
MSDKKSQKSVNQKKSSIDSRRIREWSGKTVLWEVLAAVLPFLLVGYGFIRQDVHPFGEANRQILVTDLWHQYYPFLQLLWEKLRTGGSLFFTWRSGLGTDFLSIMAYYCASPLNVIALVATRANLREVLIVILLLKFSCAGLFMAKLLRYVFKKNDVTITMFALMYALCSYMMGYYWNIIWLDTIALLPLIMLGLTALVREGKYRLYVISLAIALISNYYIGYFICIYTVLAFFCLCLYENVSWKTFGKRFAQVTGTSVMAGGLGAWILLPAALALQKTHSASNEFPSTHKFFESWTDILSNMLAYTEPTVKEGLPNLYSGLLPLILLGVFLTARKIRLREKITGVAIMAFIVISCNLNYLNFIWHGFHFTNMLPYRFAFLFSFTLILAGYRALTILLEDKPHPVHWISMIVVLLIFCYIGFQSSIQEADHKFVIYSGVLGLVYVLAVILRYFTPKQVAQGALAAVLLFEMGGQAIRGTEAVGTSDYPTYPSNDDAIQVLLQQREDDELFYRTDLTTWYTLNDPSLYLFDGVSQFSSMANERITTFCRRIGLPASEAGNRYYYANSAPLTNLLLDVRYIISKDSYNAESVMETAVATEANCRLYENQYTAGIGFMAKDAAGELELADMTNPFDQQNMLWKAITGMDEDLYTQIDMTDVGHHGYDVTRKSYGSYSFTKQSDATEFYLKWNYTAVRTGMAYAYAKVSDAKSMDPYYHDAKLHSYPIDRQPYITPVGLVNKDERVSLRIEMKGESNAGTADLFFYQIDQDVFEEGYRRLLAQKLELSAFSDTDIEGTVNAEDDGILYLSIPYSPGWSAYVDGTRTEMFEMFGAMSGIRVPLGTHEIRLRYRSPGFLPGLCMAVVCLGILVALYVVERRHSAAPAAEGEERTPEAEDKHSEPSSEQTEQKKAPAGQPAKRKRKKGKRS